VELDELLIGLDVLTDGSGSAGTVLAPTLVGFTSNFYDLKSTQSDPPAFR
jgi:hypothetical protein